MRIIYNDGNINADTIGLLQYINDFTKELGIKPVTVDDGVCFSVLNGMRMDFPHVDGLDAASIFKKLANFLTYFIAERPIKTPFPASIIGSELVQIRNHQNVIVGLHVVLDNLHNATIIPSNGGGAPAVIENRVRLSRHSYIDIVDALHAVTPSAHYHMVTVLLEQMVYKQNPGLQYDLIDF